VNWLNRLYPLFPTSVQCDVILNVGWFFDFYMLIKPKTHKLFLCYDGNPTHCFYKFFKYVYENVRLQVVIFGTHIPQWVKNVSHWQQKLVMCECSHM
jgi:hypothetical protein